MADGGWLIKEFGEHVAWCSKPMWLCLRKALLRLCPGTCRTPNWSLPETGLSVTPWTYFNTVALLNYTRRLHRGGDGTVRAPVELHLSPSFLWILASQGAGQFPGVGKTLFHGTEVYRTAKSAMYRQRW